jgi:hypothetical protein
MSNLKDRVDPGSRTGSKDDIETQNQEEEEDFVPLVPRIVQGGFKARNPNDGLTTLGYIFLTLFAATIIVLKYLPSEELVMQAPVAVAVQVEVEANFLLEAIEEQTDAPTKVISEDLDTAMEPAGVTNSGEDRTP